LCFLSLFTRGDDKNKVVVVVVVEGQGGILP